MNCGPIWLCILHPSVWETWKERPYGRSRRIESVSGGIVNILGGTSMAYSEQISSYKHVSNFRWVWRYRCLNLACADPIFVCGDGWKVKSTKKKVNTRGELVARIMNTAALIKQERQDDLRRATRTIARRVEKCIEVDGGIFEHLLWTVAIYWVHLHNQ